MRRITLALVVLTLGATSALAQTPLTFAQVDSDGNGELEFEELRAVWTDFTQDEFTAADRDGSGGLSPDELNALQKSALPAPGGE